jgi:hypothetical protein
MYLRKEGEGSRDVYKYTQAGGWVALPQLPATGALNCCATLVYTPDYQGGGLMFHGRGGYNVLFLPTNGSAWVEIPNTDAGGNTWVSGERDPINRVVMICTTDGTTCKKIDRNGVMTSAASNSSVTFYTGSGWTGHLSVDPVTGTFLALTAGLTGRHLWSYNVRTNAWTQLADPPAGMTTEVLATPISTYGATAFVSCSSGASCSGSPIYIYKHTNGTSADIDYANRCSAPGVTKCNAMDTMSTSSSDITGKDLIRYDHSAPLGNILPAGGNNIYYASVDTSVKRSGVGSLRFKLEAGQTTGDIAGQYLPQTNNGLGATFGQNSDLYAQVAVRMSPEYFTNHLNYWNSVAKIMILHANQISCGNHELTTNQWVRDGGNNLLAGYQECGTNGWRTELDGHTFKITFAGTPYLMQQGDHYCPYPANPPDPTCFRIPSNTWMTLYQHVHIGTWDNTNSTIEGWYAINGGPYVKWLNITNNYTIPSSGAGDFNNMTLSPYMTCSHDCTSAPVDAYVWYDEVVVSTRPIAAPGQPATPPPPPDATIVRIKVNSQ